MMAVAKNDVFLDTTTGEAIDPEELEFETLETEPARLNKPADDLEVVTVKRENTRGRLALSFLIGFFFLLFGGLVVAGVSDGDKIAGAKEILLTMSGILSGPLGFVIGYYFRSSEE